MKEGQIVVNFFGGPGTGKSTNALLTAGRLKKNGIEAEYAGEWIKSQLYAGNTWGFKDQRYTFAKQRKTILELMSNPKVRVVVTDSPFLLSCVYGDTSPEFQKDVLKEFAKLDSINILLRRTLPYSPVGRRQDAQGAADVDRMIRQLLDVEGIPYYELDAQDAYIVAFNQAILRLRELGVL